MGIPGTFSVYRLCTAFTSSFDGRRYLTDPVPYAYRAFADNRQHVVTEGDTWQTLAARYFAGIPGASMRWRVLWEFQPTPPVDPSVPPPAGSTVYIPSTRTLEEEIFAERRRREYEA